MIVENQKILLYIYELDTATPMKFRNIDLHDLYIKALF